MKTRLKVIFQLIFLLSIAFTIEGFSQACGLSGTELITDGGFESAANNGFGTMTSPITGGCKDVTSNAQHTGPGCGYSGFQNTANTAVGGTGHALLYDGGSTAGQLVCAVVTIDKAKTYDVSAYFKSAANSGVSIGNVANLRLTIDIGAGPVAIGAGWAPITNQTAYDKNECFYKAGGSGTVSATVCVEFQPTINTGGGGSYTSGNDALIDNFSMQEIPSPSGGCTAGTCVYPTASAAPVKLVSFIADRAGENEANLSWTSSSELNFSYYSVEKNDGSGFREIAKVPAQGSSNGLTNYQYLDIRFDKACYYRLRMVDLDGRFEYSNLTYVQKENDFAWIVNTGSFDDQKIKAVINKSTRWNIACYSMLGQEYFTENVSLQEGENNIPLNNSALIDRNPKILRITDEDGKVILSQLVVFR